MTFFIGELNFITPKYNTILSMGCSSSCFEFLFPECSPMQSRTLWTNPFLLLLKSVILAIGQWVLETLFWYTTTISLILKFLFLPSHIWSSCKDCRYSFFQWDQNLLAICWLHHQHFLLYISGLKNSSGSGETTFDFMVRIFTGGKGCRLVGSLTTSMVRGLEFKMPSTSVIIVNKEASSRPS